MKHLNFAGPSRQEDDSMNPTTRSLLEKVRESTRVIYFPLICRSQAYS